MPAPPNAPGPSPTWSTWPDAARVVFYRPHLRKSLALTVVVGTILFAINQGNIVFRGQATAEVWIKGGMTYIVPFCVANYGILVATYRRRARPH